MTTACLLNRLRQHSRGVINATTIAESKRHWQNLRNMMTPSLVLDLVDEVETARHDRLYPSPQPISTPKTSSAS